MLCRALACLAAPGEGTKSRLGPLVTCAISQFLDESSQVFEIVRVLRRPHKPPNRLPLSVQLFQMLSFDVRVPQQLHIVLEAVGIDECIFAGAGCPKQDKKTAYLSNLTKLTHFLLVDDEFVEGRRGEFFYP